MLLISASRLIEHSPYFSKHSYSFIAFLLLSKKFKLTLSWETAFLFQWSGCFSAFKKGGEKKNTSMRVTPVKLDS